uniref:BREX-1 system adenine-specific DNA-methyltransferase PglX n=1 Tax=Halomicronema sp. CCY15110 TaxID=2767773 RepID=UPI001EF1F35A
ITPFNWEIEFPEVFDRENPGFDAIVGNPPFAGKNTIIHGNPEGYLEWIKEIHPESHGNSDLVAHFFRRAFTLIRERGSYGLIATNTIAQGDTRSTGLRFICNNGGSIYSAQKRVKWPGLAAVVISVINIFKGDYLGKKFINERMESSISAFLFHAGGHDDPETLQANKDRSFIGSMIYGSGFTFDNSKPEATSLEEMSRLIERDSRNAEIIFPYIGGEEVNSSPTQSHHRYVINFAEKTEAEAREYPDLMSIVEGKVKPERERLGDNSDALRRKQKWWLWGRYTPALFKAIAQCERVLFHANISQNLGFAFIPAQTVVAAPHNVFVIEHYAGFCSLQSRVHEIWTRFFGSSMKDDLRYTPSICFETFPFPENWETDPTLEAIGKAYYEYRADLMVRNNQGLTDTYNRFHDPDERDPDILQLRDLHEQMDRAVLNAYGWPDIDTTCGFALDYLDADPDDLPPEAQDRIASGDLFFPTPDEAAAFDSLVRTGKRKLPWRYRWPEAIHDEVLARLLDLNQQRHLEEVRGHKAAGTLEKGKAKGTRTKKTSPKPQTNAPTIPGLDL